METVKNVGIAFLVSVVVLLIGLYAMPKSQTIVQQPPAGAAGQDTPGPCVASGGVMTCYGTTALNTASTTLCAIKSPTATSTLVFGSLQTNATSTALVIDLAKSSSFAATTTSIGTTYILALGNKLTLIASSTPASGALVSASVFAPNTYFVAKYGTSISLDAGAITGLTGTCKAEFVVN